MNKYLLSCLAQLKKHLRAKTSSLLLQRWLMMFSLSLAAATSVHAQSRPPDGAIFVDTLEDYQSYSITHSSFQDFASNCWSHSKKIESSSTVVLEVDGIFLGIFLVCSKESKSADILVVWERKNQNAFPGTPKVAELKENGKLSYYELNQKPANAKVGEVFGRVVALKTGETSSRWKTVISRDVITFGVDPRVISADQVYLEVPIREEGEVSMLRIALPPFRKSE